MKIGRNGPCPCGSGQKYKVCCLGKVAWENIVPLSESHFRNLTVRGKNEVFIENLAAALQLDRIDEGGDWSQVKEACTEQAVRQIYSSIIDIWPDADDLVRVLEAHRSESTALYIGSYEEDLILRGVTRHLLYADTILLPDPFTDPRRVRPEYNPLDNPNAFRVTTLKWARIWLMLTPWVEAGVVRFIRTPGDFDINLWWNSVETARTKLAANSELKAIFDQEIAETASRITANELRLLTMPDAYLVRRFAEDREAEGAEGASEIDVQRFMDLIRAKRREHPYYIADPAGTGNMLNNQFIQYFSGANYELAKLTASLTGSHLITDMRARWAEVKLDRDEVKLGQDPWQPFSKAFADLEFEFLNEVPLQSALEIRRQGFLSSFRTFFREVWRKSVQKDAFSEANAAALADTLEHEMRQAKEEFSKIRVELSRWLAAGVLSTVQRMIATATADYIGAGVLTAVSAVAGGAAYLRGRGLRRSSPAAYLLRLKERS